MSRVTPDEVRQIKTTKSGDEVIQVWIDLANAIIDSNLDCMTSDETKLTKIELSLSAHFLELVEPSRASRIKKEKADGLSTEYGRATVSNSINETTYGYAANLLSGGCLANLDKALISVKSVGTKDYVI
mgnify:CR=1 FL=1